MCRTLARPAASRGIGRLRFAPLSLLLLVSCGAPARSTGALDAAPGFEIHTIVSPELLRQANHDRNVIGAKGQFVIPSGVKRVWIDVGAHLIEWTKGELQSKSDMALIAIEPLEECWGKWPDNPRLIALPVAISTTRGWLDFNVNAVDSTSSLVKSAEGTPFSKATRTVEVRKVPVLRLEDVLERIPPELDVEFLKTDVQGLDLQVLKSAAQRLRRVAKVKAEVINARIYEGTGEFRQGTEAEFVAYMEGLGFRFAGEDVTQERAWVDQHFVNTEREGWLARARRKLRTWLGLKA